MRAARSVFRVGAARGRRVVVSGAFALILVAGALTVRGETGADRTPAAEGASKGTADKDDAAAIAWLTSGEQEPVGSLGRAVKGADGDACWIRSAQ